MVPHPRGSTSVVFEREQFQRLLDVLGQRGYRVVAPTVCEGAIVFGHVPFVSELPVGWTAELEGGTYRLKRRSDAALFGYVVGPSSLKGFLLPSEVRLWEAQRNGNGFHPLGESPETQGYAFIGVRSCDLHAVAIQDRVLAVGKHVDPFYKAFRDRSFIVAVNCGEAAGTCFCVSMGTGPRATSGFDLALTEVLESNRHYFVAEVGTKAGAEVLAEVPHKEASRLETKAADAAVARATAQMGRSMDTDGIKELLYRNYGHPRWDEVASRCLACGNCTMVCPTCFCTTVEDVTGLTGEHAERWRKWDSCFTIGFSYLHGGSIRTSLMSRYRQWMTHKLATWIDQFGTSGCVGCGRCITWCPVAIDITEEVRAIRVSERSATAEVEPTETEGRNNATA